MAVLSLELAQRIIAAIRRRTIAAGCDPLSIAVIDAFGDLIVLDKHETPARPNAVANVTDWVPTYLTAMASYYSGPLYFDCVAAEAVGGGILIRSVDGEVMGALGLSGTNAGPEAAHAAAGIEEAGLIADLGVSVH